MFAVAMLLGVSSAQAHARHKESTPAKGDVLAASPSQVSITFTQEVQKVSGTYGIEVTDEAGADVTTGDAVLSDEDRSVMTVGLQPNLPNGRYVVQYTNVSDADGDPYAAGFAFYVGVEPNAEQRAADAQLEPEEETPAPTSQSTEPAATSEPGGSPMASATATAPSSDDDEGGGSATWIILGVVVVVGIVAGFVAARMIAARRRA